MSVWLSKVSNRFSRQPSGSMHWRNLSLSVKLPLAILGLTLATVLSLMFVTAGLTKAAQLDAADEAFSASISDRASRLSLLLDSMQATILTTAGGKQTIDALYTLSSTFNDLKGDARKVLQKAYIAENPNPVGKRDLLERADGSEIYHAEHAKFHKTFRTMMLQNNLYDVFLINRSGDVVYTVYKELDFAENLVTGAFAKSNLAAVYKQAMEGKAGEVFLSPFERYSASAGAYALFMATPIVSDMGKTVGVLAIQLPEDTIATTVAGGALIGASTEVYVVDASAKAMTPSRFEGRFKTGSTIKTLPHIAEGLKGVESQMRDVKLQSGEIGSAHTRYFQKAGASWLLVAERDNKDILAEFQQLLWTQILIGSLCVILVGAMGIWAARSFVSPIGRLNQSVKEVAQGVFDHTVPYSDQRDEIGTIAASINEMRHKLAAAKGHEEGRTKLQQEQADVVTRLTSGLKGLSTGDLTQTIDEPFGQDYEGLRGYYNETVTKMRDSIEQISGATEGMRAQANEITRASEELAHRTEVQAATLEQTAAAMDEMTVSVKSAAEGVREVETIVTQARKEADDCGTVVKEAVTAMSAIEKSSDQITQIIGVIDDIAFQTNLLALNAGVEAARAGDAGRGFAVVASEVGALAQRASIAAKEIKNLIGNSSEQVERGVDRVKMAGAALQQIAMRVTEISSLTTNIATGASEQSIGLNEINIGVTQLDQATQKNAAMAEEASAASHLMASGAEELAHLVARFKTKGHGDVQSQMSHQTQPSKAPEIQVLQDEDKGLAQFLPEIDVPPVRAAVGNSRGVWQDF